MIYLIYTTTLTNIIISFPSLSSAFQPIFAIIRLVATLPGWAIFAALMFRLPFAHTNAVTKIMSINQCIFAADSFTAPVTINDLASTSKINCFTFSTTSQFFDFGEFICSIWFCVKFFVAYRTNKMLFLFAIIFSAAFSRTKPKTRLVIVNPAWFSLKFFITNMTKNGEHFHNPIIAQNGCFSKLIACQNLNRRCRGIEIEPKYVSVCLQRFLDHTGIQPRLLETAGA